ncbi:uncharacterized protein [Atheta coriaria]|uniref:uncharacterized protein n=1 Tax=Dalotia coriaria TaxID=877792 RepID=UPI0031F3B92F
MEQELRNHHIDICALQETKKKGKGQAVVGDYLLAYSGVERNERAKKGVAIMFHKKLVDHIIDITYVSARIIHAKLLLDRKRTNIISIYAPENCRPQDVREEFFNSLQHVLDSHKNEATIILGDFNSRIGNRIIPGVKQRFNEETENENGTLMTNLCTINELRINNTYYEHKQQHKHTCKKLNLGRHRKRSCPRDWEAETNIPPKETSKTCEERTKIKTEGLADQTTRELYANRLKEKVTNNNIQEGDNVDTAWERLKSNIQQAAEEALGRKIIKKPNPFAKRTPWFTEEIKMKCKEKKQAHIQHLTQRTQESYESYKQIRRETHELVRKTKSEHWRIFSKQLEHDFYGTQKTVWKTIRNQRKELTELVQAKGIDKETWINYIKHLYRDTNQEKPNISVNIQPDEPTIVSISEVETELAKLRNRKASGPDGIPNDLLKYGEEVLAAEITKLINIILKHQRVPTEWKLSTLIMMFKKGDKQEPSNYRGIALLNTTLKLTTRLLANKILAHTTLSDEQQGFRKGRSSIAEQRTDPIKVGTGVRQGDSLSPLLFNFIMEEIIARVRRCKGYQMGGKELKVVCYADDAVLISDSEDNLQRMIHQFNIASKALNMEIATEKTKCMVIAPHPIRCKLEVDGQIVQQVSEFRYLGINISSSGGVEKEVAEQVEKGLRIAGCLRNTIWDNKHLRTETKVSIYKAVVRPIFTYSAETRAETTTTQRLLTTAEMRTLRNIDGKTLLDRIKNEDIRRACNNIEDITQWCKRRKIEWNEHIERMDETRIVRIARDKSPRESDPWEDPERDGATT